MTAMVTKSGSVKTAPINPSTIAEPKQTVALALEFIPRLDDFRLVQRHAVQEHELSPAVQPQKEQTQGQTQENDKCRYGNDPIKMGQDITPRLFEAVTKISPIPVRMIAGVKISARKA